MHTVVLYGEDERTLHDWRVLFSPRQYCINAFLSKTPSPLYKPDLCVVIYHFRPGENHQWLQHVQAPTLLITSTFIEADRARNHFSQLRVVSHPQRAFSQFPQLLYLTSALQTGILVLGPIPYTQDQLLTQDQPRSTVKKAKAKAP